jgi:hypothetical protein
VTVTLRQGVTLYDGSVLSAADVSYSFTLAKSSDVYSDRLSSVAYVTVVDSNTVKFVLSANNPYVVSCLDFPIIKNGSYQMPIGSGRYRYITNQSGQFLMRNQDYFLTENGGFDVCVEACGAPETFLGCINEAAHGANIILIGNGKRETTFIHSIILKKELNIFGSRNALTKDFEELIDLVSSGKVDVMKLVSGVYDANDAKDAFEALKNNDGTIAKLLLEF